MSNDESWRGDISRHMRIPAREPLRPPPLPRWLVVGFIATAATVAVGLAIGAAVAWSLVRDGLCS